jgi:hypothetical protein
MIRPARYKELDDRIMSAIKADVHPYVDSDVLALSWKLCPDYGPSLLRRRLESLRRRGEVHFLALKWRTGRPDPEYLIERLEEEGASMKALCSVFAKALVDVMDGEADHDIQGITGLPQMDCERIAKARAQADAFLTGGTK